MYEKLETIRQKCQTYTKCPLSQSRNNIVFSDGIPNSKLMLIGEAPGYWEDQKGLPRKRLAQMAHVARYSRNKKRI